MIRMRLFLLAFISVLFVIGSVTSASAVTWSGSASSGPSTSTDAVEGTGWWGNTDVSGLGSPYNTTTVSWNITWDGVSPWVNYSYTFTHPEHDASYFILEASAGFSSSDISTSLSYGINTWVPQADPGGQFQGMPGNLFGIKFDSFSSYSADTTNKTVTETIEFDSTRLPTWGDFYARCGIHPDSEGGHGVWDAAWNGGFLNTDSNDGFHILVPDTVAAIPEPASLLLIGSGLVGLIGLRKKFK